MGGLFLRSEENVLFEKGSSKKVIENQNVGFVLFALYLPICLNV